MSVVADVQSYLASLDIVDGSSDWTSVRGVLHDGVDRLVAIKGDGGPQPEIGTDEGLGSAAYRDPRVHITIRGQPHDRDAAEEKADEIFGVLHGLFAVTMGVTEYHRVRAETPPIEVGQDDRARPRFTVAFRLAVAQGAPA